MAEQLIISVSGMRGIVGENLTTNVATDYGRAFGTYLKDNSAGQEGLLVCIGRDSRPSSEELKAAVKSGLLSTGIDVIDLGLVTTPGVGISLRELGCTGGVIITASHNPNPYNGIKLLLSNGMAPPPEAAKKIKAYYSDKQFNLVDQNNFGKATKDQKADDRHIEKVLGIIDKELISEKKFKVALDSVNGAGGPITKKLLAELGCEVFPVNDEPTGNFAHMPEPTDKNLKSFCEFVRNKNVNIGFAQDPDADRLAIVDENGTYIGEEYTLALAAKYIFRKKSGNAATNLSTSRMIDDIAGKKDSKVFRTPVGEANVAMAMIENNCIIGGEGNGGVIDLRVGPIRDSLVAIVFVLQLMAKTGKKVSELVSEIGGYFMSKEKFGVDKHQGQEIFNQAKKTFLDAKLDSADGCRFDFEDGWLHIRASNTEPVMRLIVEAIDGTVAQKYIEAVLKIRDKVLS